ncbi:type VII secretion-associated serine protease mycosin [Micromonospora pisi]|uniref:Type VII secretion-associated serine protease mycosin n=1 Tax=Micromonospora pisi TaxID=589240 RepID=A0A495JLY1_9ACTN|nr:type VII secretion-associated serine protease mycosin [Micromonospora pisi]RKR89923.1 type VII secretion-associated serine protease mycosin [Micromonospora pisi]
MIGHRTGLRRAVVALAAVIPLGVVVGAPAPALADVPPLQKQWHLDALRIKEVHRVSTGAGVVVAVVDTGVYADHPDLAGQVLDGKRMIGTDDKGKVDERNHGTGVAGLIAARGGGAGHALGIAPGAKILPVTIATNTFAGSNMPDGIRYAVDHGAKVINLSNGGPTTSPDLDEAVRYAQSKDVVVVAAAGNTAQGDTGVLYPARLPGVIAVAATDRQGAAWSGSVRGEQIAIAAPGADVSTTAGRWPDLREGGYLTVEGGTSAATAVVSGAAALIRAKYPEASAAQVVDRLVKTAVDAGPPGRDSEYGFGRLDLVKALTTDLAPVDANPLGAMPAAEAADENTVEGSGFDFGPLVAVAGALVLLVFVVVLVVVVLVNRRGRGPAHH